MRTNPPDCTIHPAYTRPCRLISGSPTHHTPRQLGTNLEICQRIASQPCVPRTYVSHWELRRAAPPTTWAVGGERGIFTPRVAERGQRHAHSACWALLYVIRKAASKPTLLVTHRALPVSDGMGWRPWMSDDHRVRGKG